jgi:FAD:protein FMN transferase
MQRNDGTFCTRRRFIAIAGTVLGTALVPSSLRASTLIHKWQGTALGADAYIQLAHPDEGEARRLIQKCVTEIRRLEAIFSLYLPHSALSRLNREGILQQAPLELTEVLARAAMISEASNGAFDVTVQPLWQRYAEHFSQQTKNIKGPDVADVLALVDWRKVRIEENKISFERSGMAVTLNGIAQGAITDNIAALLNRNGISQVLLDLGEIRALGEHPDGRAWQVGVRSPFSAQELSGTIDLTNRALATSGGYGTVFDKAAHYSHLIDPRDGHTAPVDKSVSVLTRDATTADALSTAALLMSNDDFAQVLRMFPGTEAYRAMPDGLQRIL